MCRIVWALSALLLIGIFSAGSVRLVVAGPRTWVVGDAGSADFRSIQDAVNAAESGDSVEVLSGTYVENVVLNKPLNVYSRDGPDATRLAARNPLNHVLQILKSGVNVTGFTLCNASGYMKCGVFLSGVTDCLVRDNVLSKNDVGVFADCSNRNVVENNTFASNMHGVVVWFSYCDVVSGNVLLGNSGGYAVELVESDYCRLENNTVESEGSGGICLETSSHCTVSGNSVFGGNSGIMLVDDCRDSLVSHNQAEAANYGFVLGGSSSNWLVNNTVTSNKCGLFLFCSGWAGGKPTVSSLSNTVFGNFIANNSVGVRVEDYNDLNKFYHNVFSCNLLQVRCGNSSNTWDDGYPSGGNYWSNFGGVDVCRGCYQNESGSDSIDDLPYVICPNNTDRYPLIPHIAVANITTCKTGCRPFPVVGQNCTVHVFLKVENSGNCAGPFSIIVYANETRVFTFDNVTLDTCDSSVFSFAWNTVGFARGNYTLRASASVLSGETVTRDDSLVGCWISVVGLGDVAGPDGCPDGRCDMLDVGNIATRLFTSCPDARFNANFDVNDDHRIDMRDVGIVVKHVGEHYP